MMRASILGLTFTVLAFAPQVFGFKKEDPAWMRDVTPAGQPCVEVTLAASGRAGLFENLTLTHQLRFDGVRYLSRLSIIELESHLVPKGEGIYEWRTPAGRIIIIDMTLRVKPKRDDWKIVRDVGVGEVAVVGGAQEVYVYRKSRLVEYEKAGVRYYLNLKNGVSEVTNQRGVVLVRSVDDGAGSRTISAFGSKITLQYGEGRKLLRCSSDNGGEREFFYDAGLLTAVRHGDLWRRFVWGVAKYGKYEKTEKKIPPVVVASGSYKFEYVSNGQTLSGAVYFDDSEAGTWNFSYKTDLYRHSSHK